MKSVVFQLFIASNFLFSTSFSPLPFDKAAATLTLAASNKTAQHGKTVCVDVTASDFQEIMSMQYSMKWDPKILKFKEVKGFQLPGLGSNSFGRNHAEKGLLTFSWYDFNVRGITIPDGTSLYQVCFEVVGEAGSKAYFRFTGYPTQIEISNKAGLFLDLNSINGLIKVR